MPFPANPDKARVKDSQLSRAPAKRLQRARPRACRKYSSPLSRCFHSNQ